MKCFYHNDLDGHCAGAIVKIKYPECKLYPINYGWPFPWDEIDKGEIVYMVDFCLQPFEDMERLNAMCLLRWYDHHKTSLEKGGELNCDAKALTNGIAGCQITWDELYPNSPEPEWVYYIGKFDVWDHSNPNTLPFHYGCMARETDPATSMNFWWDLWDHDDPTIYNEVVDKIVVDGRTISSYIAKKYAVAAASTAFELEWEGLRFIAANAILTGSLIFNSVWDPKKHDAMLTFGWRAKGYWTVGMYTENKNVDVSRIAVKYGGGGHAGASGFQCEELPFELC